MHVLIPTFLDLDTPDIVFVGQPQAMLIKTRYIASRFQQCTASRDLRRYITRTSVRGTQLVDLKAGTVEDIHSSFVLDTDDFQRLGVCDQIGLCDRLGVCDRNRDWSCSNDNEISRLPGQVLLGIVNRKLYARSISAKTVSVYAQEGERRKWEWE